MRIVVDAIELGYIRSLMSAGIRFSGCGAYLREVREARGRSLRDLADQSGCNKGGLSKYENDITQIPLDVLDRISTNLGLQPEVVALYFVMRRYRLSVRRLMALLKKDPAVA